MLLTKSLELVGTSSTSVSYYWYIQLIMANFIYIVQNMSSYNNAILPKPAIKPKIKHDPLDEPLY